MRPVALSERLRTVAQMVTVGNVVCDVGCDHGFVPIYLIQKGISPKVIAMDLREGPLGAAREHVAAYGMESRIVTRLSDGLHNYEKNEADTLICAGMGGGLIMRILKKDREKTASFQELVLQPQSEVEKFRRFLRESGYRILDEEMVEEDGKFYQAIRAAVGGNSDSCKGIQTEGSLTNPWDQDSLMEDKLCKLADRYGPVMLQKRTPVFLAFLEREAALYEEILCQLRAQGLEDHKRKARFTQMEELLADNRLVQDLRG